MVSQRWMASGLRCRSAVCSWMPMCSPVTTKQIAVEVVLTGCLLLRMLVLPMQTSGRS